ncbi:MAG: outer membrane lipid asymmetry maintenance protein MlaD [Proteobacteria bacterium]|nr:outer membrane lipid asymmetry maintenance protein MlaD [Pseudomonadota bacterium]
MKSNPLETAVGALVVVAAGGFLYYASNTIGISAPKDTYTVSASFRSAEGITLGTDVRMAGVKIGSVTGMELSPTTFRAELDVEIRDNVEIPDDSAIAVTSEGLLGGNFIEIIPGASEFPVENGGEIEDTQGSVSFITLLMKFVSGNE